MVDVVCLNDHMDVKYKIGGIDLIESTAPVPYGVYATNQQEDLPQQNQPTAPENSSL
jgi:hypothetical protein